MELAVLLQDRGVPCTTSDVFSAFNNLAGAAAHNAISRMPPPPMGPMGAQGMQGDPGHDAYDKYDWNPTEEVLLGFSWKGIAFEAPVPRKWSNDIPTGDLNFGDISFIELVYGEDLIKRIATFWRREFDVREDMSLFINEEELCKLKDINQYSSFPVPLPGCWARRYHQSVTGNPSGT